MKRAEELATKLNDLIENGTLEEVRAVARELAAWIKGLRAAGIPVDDAERCPPCGGTMAPGGRCLACARLVEAEPTPPPLDMALLHKFAHGVGGLRTGALRRAGYLTWTVTPEGIEALKAGGFFDGPLPDDFGR